VVQKKNNELGSSGFKKTYWNKNYSEPMEMDNIGNAYEHAQYLKSLFHLEEVAINSIMDFGFGLGHLSLAMGEIFRPRFFYGIEPSLFAYRESLKMFAASSKLYVFKPEQFKQMDLATWAKKSKAKDPVMDLGLCTSVFQYLQDEEIPGIVEAMALKVRYLYFSVPTINEFKRQKEEYDFFDEYAIHRPCDFYRTEMLKHFTIVGNRLLESKVHHNFSTSPFREEFYRF